MVDGGVAGGINATAAGGGPLAFLGPAISTVGTLTVLNAVGSAAANLGGEEPGEPGLERLRDRAEQRAICEAAALFAVTHIVFLANPFSPAAGYRLLTFFPGLLFGALRSVTGGVLAPVLFHGLCNATLAWLQAGYG